MIKINQLYKREWVVKRGIWNDTFVTCQALWIEMLFEELKITEIALMKLLVDNWFSKLSINHGRSKQV